MHLYAIKTETIGTGENLVEKALDSMKKQKLQFENNDVLAVTSKIVAYSQGRIVKLSDIKPSEESRKLAKQHSLRPEFAELILRESDKILGGVDKAILTLKDNILTANAGIDNKNAPPGFAVLWPTDPEKSANSIREQIMKATGKKIGVIIVDSGLTPLRIGTIGLAVAVAGFKPIRDTRGRADIFGKPLVITRHAVADDLASAAHLLMGEAAEKTPIVLIRDAPVDFDDGVYGPNDMMMPFQECLFMGTLKLNAKN